MIVPLVGTLVGAVVRDLLYALSMYVDSIDLILVTIPQDNLVDFYLYWLYNIRSTKSKPQLISEELMSNEPMMDVTSDDKLWAALSYVFAPIVGIIVMLMEDKKARPFIKFHAVQSIAASIAFWIIATVITTVTIGFGGLCVPILWLVFLYWAYQAYQGQMVNIPMVTNFIKGQGWA